MRKYESSLPATGIKYTALIARYKNLLTCKIKDERFLCCLVNTAGTVHLKLFVLTDIL